MAMEHSLRFPSFSVMGEVAERETALVAGNVQKWTGECCMYLKAALKTLLDIPFKPPMILVVLRLRTCVQGVRTVEKWCC